MSTTHGNMTFFSGLRLHFLWLRNDSHWLIFYRLQFNLSVKKIKLYSCARMQPCPWAQAVRLSPRRLVSAASNQLQWSEETAAAEVPGGRKVFLSDSAQLEHGLHTSLALHPHSPTPPLPAPVTALTAVSFWVQPSWWLGSEWKMSHFSSFSALLCACSQLDCEILFLADISVFVYKICGWSQGDFPKVLVEVVDVNVQWSLQITVKDDA